MIEHLDDGLIQTLLDGELSDEAEAATRAHLAECAACRARQVTAREANDQLAIALRLLDPPLAASASASAPARPLAAPPSVAAARGGWRRMGMARAAAMLLTVAAAASATVPGSPVRGLISRALDGAPSAERLEQAAAPTLAAEVAAEVAAESGVSVPLENGSFEVVLTGASPALQVRALLVAGEEGGVYGIGDAAGARFQTAPGSIRVNGVPSGEIRVEIPTAARSASIEIDGQVYLVKQGDQLRMTGSEGDSVPAEILFQVRQ